ncbi:hypothetical protein AAA799E16_02064, partial [Marine Group I thaumarchaeote SCGC AAA799-E16]
SSLITGNLTASFPAHFLPAEISIRPGDKVQWENGDAVIHTVTSGLAAPPGIETFQVSA